ncbi:hypothetical protein K0M31_002037 [Melipona bicolor]|uniref:Uncharacterized protein n=1 Tax=Melipona bicolor TaxID=60889 RepID=A0AA40GGV4_9HYME|nr:hypothetical protein K0M31_002037 [Melipona bicolor]
MIPSSTREEDRGKSLGGGEGVADEIYRDEGSGGKQTVVGRVQARENRGARYRVTNSATPEIHPFIDTHTRYADVYRRNRGLLLGSLFYLIIVSHGVLENRTTQCATEIHEKKRIHCNADWRDGDGHTANQEKESDAKRREKKERERTRRKSNGKTWKVE